MTIRNQPWAVFVGALVDDPEWTAYLATLSPNTPLRRAVAGYVRMLKARVAPTPDEVEAAERMLAAMQERGFQSADEFFAALEREAAQARVPRRTRKPRAGAKLKRLEPHRA